MAKAKPRKSSGAPAGSALTPAGNTPAPSHDVADNTTGPVRDDVGTSATLSRSVTALAPDVAMGRAFAGVVSKLGDRALLKDTARGLMNGRLTLQAVLGSLVEAGANAVEAATLEGQRAADREVLAGRQVRADLVRLKTNAPLPRPRKDDYAVRGQVSYATGEPASGLVVQVIDKDVSRHDTLGAAVTDDKGTFQVLLSSKAFAQGSEKSPEIVLTIGLEDRPAIHVTEPLRLADGERQVTLTVTLPADAQGPVGGAERLGARIDARLFRVEQRQSVVQMQHKQLSAMANDAQLGLVALLAVLQPGTPPPAKAVSSKARAKRRT